jgi:NADH-quinone oxidoreductase subunit E
MNETVHKAGTQGDATPPLPAHVKEELDRWVARFPEGRQRSAIIAGLHAAKHENHGHLTRALMDGVAAYLGVPPIQVYEIATFYSMFETEKVGRHSVSVCTNVSCLLRGGDEILSHVEERLGIRIGESTPDGRIFLKCEEECLAACCGAPMMMVDHRYYEHLTTDQVDEILDALE